MNIVEQHGHGWEGMLRMKDQDRGTKASVELSLWNLRGLRCVQSKIASGDCDAC